MSAADINISFGADTAGIQQAMADIRQSVNQTTVGITQSFSTVNKTITETRNKFVTINNAIEQTKNKWTDFADKTAAIRNSFRIVTATASTLKNALSAPLAQFSRYEDAATRLAPLVGGLEAAKSLCEELRDEAANGTMSFEQLAAVAGRLSTVSSDSADVKKWTEAFHNLSAGTGLDVNELVGNFVKSKASGRFEAGFMDMFAQKGVNLFQELVKQTGVAETELRKMATAGTLSFAEVEKAILAVSTGTGQFAGQAAAMSGTFSGSVGTMRENWNTLLAEFARPIAESLTPWLKKISELFVEIRGAASGFGTTLVNLTPAAVAVGSAFAALKVATLALNGAMAANPATMLAAGLAVLASLAGGAFLDALREDEKAAEDLNAALLRLDDAQRRMEKASSAAALADAYRAASGAVDEISSAGTSLNTEILYDNIRALREKRDAELAAAEAASRHAEAQKRAAEAAEKGAKLIADFEASRKNRADEKELSAAPASERAAVFLRLKGYTSAEELREWVDFERSNLAANGGGSESWASQNYKRRIEELDRYEELLAQAEAEERRRAQVEQEAAARREKANAAYAQRKALLEAELAGNENLRKSLDAVARARALAAEYEASGMDPETAATRAAEIVAKESAAAELRRPAGTPLGSGRVADELASVGGGRALNLGGNGENPVLRAAQASLGVQQKMRDLLAAISENTARAPAASYA